MKSQCFIALILESHLCCRLMPLIIGIGAVLLQGESDSRYPVAYVKRKLYPREVRYSTVEKECLAVKWALDTFRYYLLGREFTIETDHRPLHWMDRMQDTNARITRWYLSMQPYKFNC